jgi:ATP-dependent Clp protease ATP-binding subunit ClpA
VFERFTDRARQAVVLAQEEARLLGHGHIGTEHLLLGLLHEGQGVAAIALRRLGIGLESIREDVDGLIGRADDSPPGHIPFTARAKKVLELSLREALALGHNYIGTEHILLGVVREGEGVAAQVLGRRGVSEAQVRAVVVDELRGGAAPESWGRVPRPGEPARTPGANAAVAAANDLAATAPTGSQHLLEALARSEDTLAGRVLAALGVDAEAIAAKIDELGVEGTTDVTPEQAAAGQMEIRLHGEEVHLVLRDETSVQLARTITDAVSGPVRGDDAAAGSLVGLWQAIVAQLEDVRRRVAPLPDETEAGPRRSTLVRLAIENRLARRRRR